MFERNTCVFIYFTICVYLSVVLITYADKTYYIQTERACLIYENPKYIRILQFSSQRFERRNPIYYVSLHYKSEIVFDNSVLVDFYFYEFLSNEYRRSFVEMHLNFCNLVHKNLFFGKMMKQGKLAKSCPYPPDVYILDNMTINPDAVPPGFPFTKGRIFANISKIDTKEMIARGYIDMELKEKNIKKKDKRKN